MKSEVDRKKRLENDDEDSKLFRESEKRNETREESENESQVVNIYFIGKRESCFCHFLNT